MKEQHSVAANWKHSFMTNRFLGSLYFGLRFGWPARRIQPFFGVKGWLDNLEAAELFRLAHWELKDPQPTVLEIGSFQGKSAIVFGKALMGKPKARIFCIDPFIPSGDAEFLQSVARMKSELPDDLFQQFLANLDQAGVRKMIIPLRGFSHEVVKTWMEPLDLLFIDGNHEYQACERDFLDWSKFLKIGGIIAFHDVSFQKEGRLQGLYEGPGLVVKKYIQGSPSWADQRHIASLYVAKKVC